MSYIAYFSSVCEFFPTNWYQSFMLRVPSEEREREREKCALECFGRKKRRDGKSCERYDGAAIDKENQL